MSGDGTISPLEAKEKIREIRERCKECAKEITMDESYWASLALGMPAMEEGTWNKEEVASMIDHTNLSPTAYHDILDKLVDEAIQYQFASICVHGSHVSYIADAVRSRNASIPICAVVGFPHGCMSTKSKSYEAKCAIEDGATEIDMVVHQGALLARDYRTVYEDIASVVQSVSPHTVKVILECSNLTVDSLDPLLDASILAVAAGAAYLKTSTGFSASGADPVHVRWMRWIASDRAKVKASGGIRTWEDALRMVRAGARRLGASRGVSMVGP